MFSIIKIQNRCSLESEELTMKQQKFMLHQLILFIIVFLLGLLLVFTIGKCFFMNGIKVEAHNKNQKYFTTIEIEEGDTLWEIAKKYHTTVSKITEQNDIDASESIYRKKLII